MTTQSTITIKPLPPPATFTPAAQRAMYRALQRASTVLAYAVSLRVPFDGGADATLKVVDDALRLAQDGAQ